MQTRSMTRNIMEEAKKQGKNVKKAGKKADKKYKTENATPCFDETEYYNFHNNREIYNKEQEEGDLQELNPSSFVWEDLILMLGIHPITNHTFYVDVRTGVVSVLLLISLDCCISAARITRYGLVDLL